MNDKKEHSIDNPIVEIRRIRDEHAKDCNYEITAMYEDILKFAKEQNLEMVAPPAKLVDKKTV